jgi:SAM-dependent methyltransferase
MPETVPCNLCDSTEVVPEPKKARFLNIREPFGVGRCRRCGLMFLNPRPTVAELGMMYATHPYYSAENARRGEPRRGFYSSRIERLERWRPQRGTMLVIGCLEGGYALEAAQRRGWRVLGVEFSKTLARYAREHLGGDVQVAEAWDLSALAGRQFDAIYTHSLEHFTDPRKTVRQARNLLAKDGFFMLEGANELYSLKNTIKQRVVDLAGYKPRALSYAEVDAEFHTFYFDPRTTRSLLRSEGFEVLELRTYLPRHPVFLANPRLRWLQEFFYAIGGLFERGPSIEVIARPVSAPAT